MTKAELPAVLNATLEKVLDAHYTPEQRAELAERSTGQPPPARNLDDHAEAVLHELLDAISRAVTGTAQRGWCGDDGAYFAALGAAYEAVVRAEMVRNRNMTSPLPAPAETCETCGAAGHLACDMKRR